MRKLMLGLFLGAGLGAIDGTLAIAYHPDDPMIRADIGAIIMMGIFKGLVTGLAIGFFARKLRSLTAGVVIGLAIGFGLAVPLAIWVGKYTLEILLPGAVMGLILGYATQRYGPRLSRSAS